MTITKEQVLNLNPCKEGRDWFLENGKDTEDLKELLLRINDKRFDWASWLFANLMSKEQKVELSIFAAREVLPVFEKEYPKDNRPRKAIETAEKWLKEQTEENRELAVHAGHKADFVFDNLYVAANNEVLQVIKAAAKTAQAMIVAYSAQHVAIHTTRANHSIKLKLINKAVEMLNKEVEK